MISISQAMERNVQHLPLENTIGDLTRAVNQLNSNVGVTGPLGAMAGDTGKRIAPIEPVKETAYQKRVANAAKAREGKKRKAQQFKDTGATLPDILPQERVDLKAQEPLKKKTTMMPAQASMRKEEDYQADQREQADRNASDAERVAMKEKRWGEVISLLKEIRDVRPSVSVAAAGEAPAPPPAVTPKMKAPEAPKEHRSGLFAFMQSEPFVF
jgi:hypothetical protein